MQKFNISIAIFCVFSLFAASPVIADDITNVISKPVNVFKASTKFRKMPSAKVVYLDKYGNTRGW